MWESASAGSGAPRTDECSFTIYASCCCTDVLSVWSTRAGNGAATHWRHVDAELVQALRTDFTANICGQKDEDGNEVYKYMVDNVLILIRSLMQRHKWSSKWCCLPPSSPCMFFFAYKRLLFPFFVAGTIRFPFLLCARATTKKQGKKAL